MDAIFVDGLPAKITIHDFRRHHLQSFPVLADVEYDELLTEAIDVIYSMFHGIADMWDMHRDKQVWYEKTTLCYRLLVAWFLKDQFPELASGNSAPIWLREKRVDGVHLKFNLERFNYSDSLTFLSSNNFGTMALMMIQNSPRRALLRVTRFA